jgi:hypothetical protein
MEACSLTPDGAVYGSRGGAEKKRAVTGAGPVMQLQWSDMEVQCSDTGVQEQEQEQ